MNFLENKILEVTDYSLDQAHNQIEKTGTVGYKKKDNSTFVILGDSDLVYKLDGDRLISEVDEEQFCLVSHVE